MKILKNKEQGEILYDILLQTVDNLICQLDRLALEQAILEKKSKINTSISENKDWLSLCKLNSQEYQNIKATRGPKSWFYNCVTKQYWELYEKSFEEQLKNTYSEEFSEDKKNLR